MIYSDLLKINLILWILPCQMLLGEVSISNISPATGFCEGGEKIVIEGSGFENVTKVRFGSIPVDTFHIDSDHAITMITPQGSLGRVCVSASSTETSSNVPFIYRGPLNAIVVNHGSKTVTPIDLSTNTPKASLTVGNTPASIAITPDGKTAYITDDFLHAVIPIDIATYKAGIPISAGMVPYSIAINPEGTKAYVSNHLSGTITPIDLITNTPGDPITVGSMPFGVAISPDGKTVYVANSGSKTISPIDVETQQAGIPIPVGIFPSGIAITPDGKTAYVTNTGSNNVTPIDLATHQPRIPIQVGINPAGIAIAADGKMAYVVNASTNNVTPVDLNLNIPLAPIPVGQTPACITITPDCKTALVTNQGSNSVTIIDLTTHTPIMVIPVGNVPFGVAITPDQAPVASFKPIPAPIGHPTIFDASASTSPSGEVVGFEWDFGDGHTLVTGVPIITHTYAVEGNYNVSLVVTNSASSSLERRYTGQTISNNGGESARCIQNLLLNTRFPVPPSQFKGAISKKQFYNRTEYTHHLTWEPSQDVAVVGYLLLRNGHLVAEIPVDGPFQFDDPNRKKGTRDVYTLTSYNAEGLQSIPLYLILPEN